MLQGVLNLKFGLRLKSRTRFLVKDEWSPVLILSILPIPSKSRDEGFTRIMEFRVRYQS